jgi:hypothetical protein
MNKKMKTYSKDDKDSATPGLSPNNDIKADCSSVSQHIIKPVVEPTPTVKTSWIITKITELPLSLNKLYHEKKMSTAK